MSRINCHPIKRAIFFLLLLLLLIVFLVGCGRANDANSPSTSGTTAGQNTPTNASSSTTNVQDGDQQVQDILQSLDNAQQDDSNASTSGDQQDSVPTP